MFLFQTTEKELMIVLRVCMVIIGSLSVIIATLIKSLIALFPLMTDLTYVIVLPQLIAVIYIPFTNTYGSLAGLLSGLLLRLLSGEFYIRLPAVIKYPWYVEKTGLQLFPFKTLIMLCCIVIIVIVSVFMEQMFKCSSIVRRMDSAGLKCFGETQTDSVPNEALSSPVNPDAHDDVKRNQYKNDEFTTHV